MTKWQTDQFHHTFKWFLLKASSTNEPKCRCQVYSGYWWALACIDENGIELSRETGKQQKLMNWVQSDKCTTTRTTTSSTTSTFSTSTSARFSTTFATSTSSTSSISTTSTTLTTSSYSATSKTSTTSTTMTTTSSKSSTSATSVTISKETENSTCVFLQ